MKEFPTPDLPTALLALALAMMVATILMASHWRCAQAGCRRCQAFLSATTPLSPSAAPSADSAFKRYGEKKR